MSTNDTSRFLFQPRKRYAGVRMQQGRVILDSDWNESARVDDEDTRQTTIDVIGPKGTSDDGFRVDQVEARRVDVPGGDSVQSYDFQLGRGSYYLGGLRFETETGNETFLHQEDWPLLNATPDSLPVAPTLEEVANGPRYDLVYLEGWEQCVTAVEDRELREAALGGPDTSTRVRRARRVRVATDVGGDGDCLSAFAEVVEQIQGTGEFV